MITLLPNRVTPRSLHLFIEKKYGGDAGRFLADMSDAMNRAMRTDLKSARELATRINRLTRFFRGRDLAFLIRIGARYHHLSGNTRMALGGYRRARRVFLDAGEEIEGARIGRAMVDVLMYLGSYKEAVQIGRDSARVFRRRKMVVEWAQTICNVGNVYHRQDDNPRALRAYDSAHSVFAEQGRTPALALVQFNRGNIFANLNRLNKAAECYREALSIYSEAGMNLAAAQTEYSLAYLRFLQGGLADSLTEFEKVRATFEKLGDERGQAQTWLDMLEVHLQLNLHTVVESDAPPVLQRFEKLGMSYEQAKCCYFLAKALAGLEDTHGAIKAIRQARRRLNGEGNPVWRGSTDLLEARLAASSGDRATARALARSASSAFRHAGDARRVASASLFLAELDLEAGRLSRARQRLASYLANTSSFPTDIVFDAWWLNGRLLRAAGDRRGAIKSYELAMRSAERLVEGVAPDETRIFYLADKLAVYHGLIGLLLEAGRNRAALQVLEESKQVRRADFRSAVQKSSDMALPEPLRRRQDELRSRLRHLYGFPSSLDRFAPVNFEILRRSEDQLWRVVQRGRRICGIPAARVTGRSTAAVGRKVPAGRGILAFATDGENPRVFILTESHIRCRKLPAGWKRLSDLLAQFYFFIEKNRIPGGFRVRHENEIIGGTRRLLEDLASAVLWPILGDLDGILDLTFVPFGMLHSIPFHALPLPDGTPIGFSRKVRHAVDVAGALNPRAAVLPAATHGAIFSPGREETRAMDEEAAQIRDMYPGSAHFQGDDAGTGQLKSSLADDSTTFLHIASHASAALDNPVFSEILLSDGPFYAFDLFGQQVQKALVTLSACQTGRPGVLPSGEIYGLADAFIGQGAQCVLSSLWTVEDHTARILMTKFYQRLKAGDGLNCAWTSAMREMREIYDNPYHWAPFVLIGSTN